MRVKGPERCRGALVARSAPAMRNACSESRQNSRSAPHLVKSVRGCCRVECLNGGKESIV
jgi:hypothetical protein